MFRAKYVQQVRASGITGKPLLNSLFSKPWVVYAKRPFAGPKQVMEYLGRYTHNLSRTCFGKVAISNHRIKEVGDNDVSFSYKDYRDKASPVKVITLSAMEFVRRFAQHILPYRFVRIRHYGLLSSAWKRGRLQKLQEQLNVHRPEQVPKTLLRKCPCCKTGTLVTIEIFGKRGPPQAYLLPKQSVPVQQP